MAYKSITDKNYAEIAEAIYASSQSSSFSEFKSDVKRILYVKKLITRYKNTGDLSYRLILNHLIILKNVFGKDLSSLLFFKVDKSNWKILIPLINYAKIEYDMDEMSNIVLDEKVVSILSKLK